MLDSALDSRHLTLSAFRLCLHDRKPQKYIVTDIYTWNVVDVIKKLFFLLPPGLSIYLHLD